MISCSTVSIVNFERVIVEGMAGIGKTYDFA